MHHLPSPTSTDAMSSAAPTPVALGHFGLSLTLPGSSTSEQQPTDSDEQYNQVPSAVLLSNDEKHELEAVRSLLKKHRYLTSLDLKTNIGLKIVSKSSALADAALKQNRNRGTEKPVATAKQLRKIVKDVKSEMG